jgi:hypothetical protein
MHILNNENKGIREATLWKTFWKGEENIRHKFSRAMARKGLLEVGVKKLTEKAAGFWLVLGGPPIKMPPDVYRLQVLVREWA